ncbi:hypothetical protein [Nostoc sp. C110]|uniref:hypothetical protein n=1 Tax=Nostoc sp. C110 TaxID=3349876 RepID=UPI00370D1CAA
MGDNLLVCAFPLITLEPNQLNLFSDLTVTPARRAETLVMSLEVLLKWKSQIFEYQYYVRENKPPQQTVLFDLPLKHCNPDQIDPLLLRLVPMSFYRMPANSPGDACLYFIIDSAAGLILYVGEPVVVTSDGRVYTPAKITSPATTGFTLSLWVTLQQSTPHFGGMLRLIDAHGKSWS